MFMLRQQHRTTVQNSTFNIEIPRTGTWINPIEGTDILRVAMPTSYKLE
jgi:hypothetical protein